MIAPRLLMATSLAVGLRLIVPSAHALDVLELADLPAAEQQRMLDAFLEADAPSAPPGDLVQFFDSEMVQLRFDQLDSIYLCLAPRMPRTAFPILSKEALSKVPYMAAPALRLIGLTANNDAFDVLSRRIGDQDEETACGAIAGMGFLGDRRAISLLERLLARADRDVPLTRREAETALALAHLGNFQHLQDWFVFLGDLDAARLMQTHTGTRIHYTPAKTREAALKDARRIERLLAYKDLSFRRLWSREPRGVSAAVAACTHTPALELLYDAMVETMEPRRAVGMLPLLESRSIEIRGTFLEFALPHLEGEHRHAALGRIADDAADPRDSRSRVFAAQYCRLLPAKQRDDVLERLLRDPSPWVRAEAARAAGELAAPRFADQLRRLADGDPDSLVRVAAQAALPLPSAP